MNADSPPTYEWDTLPWRTIERAVFKLQKRIYQAAQRQDLALVHRLQRVLLASWSARCVAVRRVTQDNQGKKTAGVDGVKSLTPAQRLHLVQRLRVDLKAQPVRRVWIPKPNAPDEQRPLGIPTISNRAAQMLAKLALEPEWEAYFEPNSYGFRPGRSCRDAIQAIFGSIVLKPKYVLDADIAKCFDRINHTALLAKLHTFPALRRGIKGWLTAGVVENGAWFPTPEGSPQGGCISPLVANVALHGLEEAITSAMRRKRDRPTVIRYADDFVVLHADEQVIKQAQQVATEWLGQMGLALKLSKTRITHTLHPYKGTVGFDFLGCSIRQYPVSKSHSGKQSNGDLLGFTTLIQPSPTALRRHREALKTTIGRHGSAPQAAVIHHLNPLIRGWSNYYAGVNAKQQFSEMDHYLFKQLWQWAKHRHRQKTGRWMAETYWHPKQGRWQFGTGTTTLQQHAHTPIRRHTKVRGTKSPFDGEWMYWTMRQGAHPDTPPKAAYLLRQQQGKCPQCGLYLRDGDVLEIDHWIPTSLGGSDQYSNLQWLHRHCHDQKTARDGSLPGGADNNGQISEEPDEANSFMSGFEAERRGRPRRLG
jgi:RNA-directed DNA polymerase